MIKSVNNKPEKADRTRAKPFAVGVCRDSGVALLVVLFVVMAVTILSLSFLSGSNVELASGKNMAGVVQLDYTAESGLEHAKGLIISPHDISTEYWTGDTDMQLASGNEYYDVSVVRDDSDSTDKCNFNIECSAYRIVNSEQVGLSSLSASLRLDPCIAYWVGSSTTVSQQISIYGDVYCAGDLENLGIIQGDAFASGIITGVGVSGSVNASTVDVPVSQPDVDISDYYSSYYVGSTGYSPDMVSYYHPSGTFQPGTDNPGGVRYGTYLEMRGDIDIEGTLVTRGLIVKGTNNTITAPRNFPALVINGGLRIYTGSFVVTGLVVVYGDIIVSSDAELTINGSLYAQNGICETLNEVMGNYYGKLYHGPVWRPTEGYYSGALEFDGINDYVQTYDSSSKLQFVNDYTLSVCLKANENQNDGAVIFSRCDELGTTTHWGLQFDSSNPKRLMVYHSTDSWDTGIRLSDIDGAWHHIGIVRSADLMTAYLDGTPYNSGTWSSAPVSGYGHLNIGIDKGAQSSYTYTGLIDELRIYNQALTPADLYPPHGGVSGLIAYWNFNESGASITITGDPCKTAVRVWASDGSIKEQWQQVGGAFFSKIERN